MTTSEEIKKLEARMQRMEAEIEQVRADFAAALQESQSFLALATQPRTVELELGREPLYEALRGWRKKEAGFREVAAFQVFSNRMLTEIANALPATTRDLEDIKGIGPDRIEKYGDAVLQMVAEYRSEW